MNLLQLVIVDMRLKVDVNRRITLFVSTTVIDRFHSRDKNLDNRCYAAILVYRNENKAKSVPRKSNGVVYGCEMWK